MNGNPPYQSDLTCERAVRLARWKQAKSRADWVRLSRQAAGLVRSEWKAENARRNGAKGGRPRKNPTSHPDFIQKTQQIKLLLSVTVARFGVRA